MLDETIKVERRQFIAAGLFGPVGLRGLLQLRDEIRCCRGKNPLACIRGHNHDVLVALLETQLCALWDGPSADSAPAVAQDVLRYVAHLGTQEQRGLCGALVLLNFHSMQTTGRRLSCLAVNDRKRLLNQGEHPAIFSPGQRLTGKTGGMITWDSQYLLHAAASAWAMVGRLVISSREPARRFVNLYWSKPCRQPENLVAMNAPAYPDLSVEYDVCVIGSGAGGAVVAARAAEAGRRVLIVEEGDWVSPHSLVESWHDGESAAAVMPARDDVVLMRLYQGAGVQVAAKLPGGGGEGGRGRDRLRDMRRRMQSVTPEQTINVIQAKVVGGGPYVNNAIHFEIPENAWEAWGEGRPPVSYAEFSTRMREVKQALGVNTTASERAAGIRSLKFVEGCRNAKIEVRPAPVAMLQESFGCGSDNSVDPFGQRTGGLHPYRPGGPNSNFMRALNAPLPAQIACGSRAVRLAFAQSAGVRGAELIVEDLRNAARGGTGRRFRVRAKQYVLAAGPLASTRFLAASLQAHGLRVRGLGEGLTANVSIPVYALYDDPLPVAGPHPEPGIAQCFYVPAEYRTHGGRQVMIMPAIENWFHYPGTIATVLSGWFDHFGETMRHYNHMALAAMLTPTRPRAENRVDADGRAVLKIDQEEFRMTLRAVERIGRIFLASSARGVRLHIPTKGLLLDGRCRPLEIRGEAQLLWAIQEMHQRGPAFLQLAASHPQGGNALGTVVDPATFRVRLADGRNVENLFLADASLFPSGCEVNPQLTVKALAMYAADALLRLGS